MLFQEHAADRFACLAGEDSEAETGDVDTQTFRPKNLMA
jgi:hypothetical protein